MNRIALLYVVTAAILFGTSTPLAKILLKDISPVTLAGLMYLGSFGGLSLVRLFTLTKKNVQHAKFKTKDYVSLVIVILSGGIFAPIALMFGLLKTSGLLASLLLNLEGVMTAVLASLFFFETIGVRVWIAIMCMTGASVFLSWDLTKGGFSLAGPVLIFLASLGWGIDNNFTRKLSDKNPVFIAQMKGLFAGTTSLGIAILLKMAIPWEAPLVFALLLGSLGYGASLVLYIKALQGLGSARVGAFFSLAPFAGVIFSILVLREWIGWIFFPAIFFMLAGVHLLLTEKHSHKHRHEPLIHVHRHRHDDLHHLHKYPGEVIIAHTHGHQHEAIEHVHLHWPDIHHRHLH